MEEDLKVSEALTEEICPTCGEKLYVQKKESKFFSQLILKCKKCFYNFVFPPREKIVEIPEDVKLSQPLKPVKRVRGISAKESQRLYRMTPAGKAAWERYRYSELFYEAHARHRQTDKYKETQKRYKEKIKLFKKLLGITPREEDFTCPLKLFIRENGQTMNNQEKCNFNPELNDCSLSCLNTN